MNGSVEALEVNYQLNYQGGMDKKQSPIGKEAIIIHN